MRVLRVTFAVLAAAVVMSSVRAEATDAQTSHADHLISLRGVMPQPDDLQHGKRVAPFHGIPAIDSPGFPADGATQGTAGPAVATVRSAMLPDSAPYTATNISSASTQCSHARSIAARLIRAGNWVGSEISPTAAHRCDGEIAPSVRSGLVPND